MNDLFTYLLYFVTVLLLGISFLKDKKKTILSLKKAGQMFINVLPQFITILLLAGLLSSFITQDTIEHVIGVESGFAGMLIAGMLGALTLVPALIAFPVAAQLLQSGAGVPQITVFISTLTMVGFVTLPLEIKYLGKKVAVFRNVFAFLFAFVTALIMGVVLP